jgi:hypothetical protein
VGRQVDGHAIVRGLGRRAVAGRVILDAELIWVYDEA